MLDKYKIEKLKTAIKDGEEAKIKIDKYEELSNTIQFLSNYIKTINRFNISKIVCTTQIGDTLLNIQDKEFATKCIISIIENEMKILKTKLDELE